ncbi:aggregation-promoting factor C-terminal-like domain-containing protein [Murinocardiopsis flavida]|uniref:aggregation-promoting factor C-terminal-like domain-containing protein n=1 Tax=Murinocardiopsis flavida TaxID=645275 RepID=UPI000D0E2E15|nr:lytic transglycosylase domain-containing protein [Murinocardiopsis flavida]
MLFNRISLRLAVAAGAAAVVAGGTFAVSAFADSDTKSDQAASAAVGGQAPQADTSETPFFPKAEKVSKKELEDQQQQSKKKRSEAAGAGSTDASGKVEAKKKEKPKEDSDSGGGSSGGSVPSGSPKSIAKGMLGDYGWGGDQFNCLEPLWEKESNWNPSAKNPSSGAYGIPQSLPGSKMASAGSDWESNPATQIKWGLGYIEDRYGSPCGAWEHSQSNGWY